MEHRSLARRLSGISTAVVGIRFSRPPVNVDWHRGDVAILAGLGGALDPAMSVGDVLVDDRDACLPPAFACHRGRIHTAGEVVSSAEQKRSLRAATTASVVDMEQSLARAWLAERGVPLVGIRAVSDAAADAVDPIVSRIVDDIGRPKAWATAAALLRQPRHVGALRRLGRDARIALAALGPVVECAVVALSH